MDDEPKRYLIVVQFRADTSVADLAKRVPSMQNFISQICKGDMEQAFRSEEGLTFGVFCKTTKPLAMIRSILDGATPNGDTFLIVEIGADAAAKGFGRPLTWIQRH